MFTIGKYAASDPLTPSLPRPPVAIPFLQGSASRILSWHSFMQWGDPNLFFANELWLCAWEVYHRKEVESCILSTKYVGTYDRDLFANRRKSLLSLYLCLPPLVPYSPSSSSLLQRRFLVFLSGSPSGGASWGCCMNKTEQSKATPPYLTHFLSPFGSSDPSPEPLHERWDPVSMTPAKCSVTFIPSGLLCPNNKAPVFGYPYEVPTSSKCCPFSVMRFTFGANLPYPPFRLWPAEETKYCHFASIPSFPWAQWE